MGLLNLKRAVLKAQVGPPSEQGLPTQGKKDTSPSRLALLALQPQGQEYSSSYLKIGSDWPGHGHGLVHMFIPEPITLPEAWNTLIGQA